ncbi:hypothetical protein AB9F35_15025 [Rhizobium leguminosarum]|uniref:hypothetical protein n=1 Tax=Rhizobium leguminosarum TaxID=384 RepID=UPI003F96326F
MNDKKSLTLEVGKYYRTAKGKKALCIGKDSQGQWFFEAMNDNHNKLDRFYRVDSSGRNIAGNDFWHIEAEWDEPKRIKGWIAVFGREGGLDLSSLASVSDVFATREQVIAAIHRPATGIIEIDVLEGAGLEGEVA